MPRSASSSGRLTLRGIARQLGVSSAAVSLALRKSPRVSEALRARVVRLAESGGYIPNVRIAALMSEVRRSRTPEFRAAVGAFSLYAAERPWEERPYLKEMLDAAIATAALHGYRMEYFWLKRPGLTAQRFGGIMRARGIEGLFCLGSPENTERMPVPLQQFALVLQGPSIAARHHRVLANAIGDAQRLFTELLARGYRRPGLVVVPSGDARSRHVYSATFTGFQERNEFPLPAVPILRAETWDEAGFDRWFRAHQPDVLVLHQMPPYVAAVAQFLTGKRGLRFPRDLGFVLLNCAEALDARHSGVFQSSAVCGALAAEMLMGRVHLRDFGPVRTPRTELFDGEWREGATLQRKPSGRTG